MPTVSVYLSEDVFLDVTKVADDKDISVSKVLSSSFRSPIKKEVAGYVDALAGIEKRLDSIEKKLDNLIKVYRIEHAESPVKEAEKIKKEQVDPKILEANDRLTKIKTEVKGALNTPEKVSQFLGGYSKDRQLGKRGAK